MKRALFLVLVSFCAQLIFCAENVWCGGASGEWNVAGNWSLGKVPNAKDDVAVINATSDTTITLTQNITLGGIKVTGNFANI